MLKQKLLQNIGLFIHFQNAEYRQIILLFILSLLKRSNMVDFS